MTAAVPPSARTAGRRASDGSPYPDRAHPSGGFERDVRAMFTHIAERYDWFDHVASLGNDYLWRPRALWDLARYRQAESPVRRILDLGCGTGDLTQLAARQFPRAEVVGVDFTAAMLALADRRRHGERVAPRLRYARASALGLPFRNESFDVAMSAFVARNLPNLEAALTEVRRVLVPGGTLLTLEITEPSSPTFRSIFHAYFDRVVPWLGAVVKSAGPYRYLPESLRYLPDRNGMRAMFERLGYERTEAYDQSMGIVTTYLARRSGGPGNSERER